MKGFLARRAVFFLLVGLKSRKRLMVWLGAFIWVLAHKEKDADITSKTKSQPKQKGFRGFLFYFPHFNKIDEEPMKAHFLWLSLLIRFGNKNKFGFILYSTHLFIPLNLVLNYFRSDKEIKKLFLFRLSLAYSYL